MFFKVKLRFLRKIAQKCIRKSANICHLAIFDILIAVNYGNRLGVSKKRKRDWNLHLNYIAEKKSTTNHHFVIYDNDFFDQAVSMVNIICNDIGSKILTLFCLKLASSLMHMLNYSIVSIAPRLSHIKRLWNKCEIESAERMRRKMLSVVVE